MHAVRGGNKWIIIIILLIGIQRGGNLNSKRGNCEREERERGKEELNYLKKEKERISHRKYFLLLPVLGSRLELQNWT